MDKMTKWEKGLEFAGFIIIIASIVMKCVLGVTDTGTLVMTAFMAVMLYVIFLVCAFFPADWRMTQKQRAKIKDLSKYQMKYRKTFVIINFVISFGLSCAIVLI